MTNIKFIIVSFSLFSFFIFQEANAQKKKDVRDIIMSGNEYYFKDQFSKAIDFYYKAITIDSLNAYANYHLAECHRMTFNFEEAEKYYYIVASNYKNEYPLAAFYFPQMQKLNGKFEEAIRSFDIFIKYSQGNDFPEKNEFLEKAVIEQRGCHFAIKHLENPFGEYELKTLEEPINSKYNDYGPFILENDSTIGLTSGRSTATGKILNNRYGEYFSDNFRFTKDSVGWVATSSEDNFNINNTEFGEGAGSYSGAKDVFYFTGCYDDGSFCKIYRADKKDGKWQAAVELPSPINLKGTDNKQPSVTFGGDTLFFISNRPGGHGGSDIWMSTLNEGESWTIPVNLGEKVNTAYNEVSPFYYQQDDILFFASDGHEGLGGMDIFMAKGGLANIQSVENLGYPFNSNHDDGYLILGEKKGYFSSNREGGLGNFDVLQFNIMTQQSIIAEVQEQDKKLQRILRSRVNSRSGGEVYVMREEDKFFYENLKRDEKAIMGKILASKVENMGKGGELTLTSEERALYEQLPLLDKLRLDRMAKVLYSEGNADLGNYLKTLPVRTTLFSYLTISGKLNDTKSGMPAPGVLIPLADESGKIVKETTTSDDGSFKYINLALNAQYRILAENIPKKLTESAKFFIKDLQIEEVTKQPVVINFEDIYFDVNEEELRPEARMVLSDLVAYYKDNPQIQIEIYAYTDTTGSDEHNLQLSKSRGKAAYDFLVAANIDRSSLVFEARGKDVSAFSDISQVNMQLNRRVEFSIVGATKPYSSTVKTYILKKKISLEQLAKLTGNSVSELKLLNGFTTADIPAYTPIRINSTGVLNIPDSLYPSPEDGSGTI